MLTASERKMRARLAAYSLHATDAGRETTRKAREGFLQSFERQVDPDGVLPPEERARRAESAKKAHFQRLALKSAKARRLKVERRRAGQKEG